MTSRHIDYLRREADRLALEIETEKKNAVPNELHVARLEKLKRAVSDEIAAWVRDHEPDLVA